jgi:putative transposase
MTNPPRIHMPGGTYYLFRRTESRHPIFSEPEDYIRFEDALMLAMDSSGAKLLGYCWLPESLHLAIEIRDEPVARFMKKLTWRYSRRRWQRPDQTRPWFRERYHATLIQAEMYLEALICHLHHLPEHAGFATSPDDYRYSSHHAYLGRRTGPRVYTRQLLRSLGCRANDRTRYRTATAQPPSESLSMLFERGLPCAPGILGDKAFISMQQPGSRRTRTLRPTRSLDSLITNVAERHEVSLDELCSKFRRRELVLARAQVTWFAILWEIATMKDIARRLQHNPSTLSRAVARYRKLQPGLFRPEAIAPAGPASWPLILATSSRQSPDISQRHAGVLYEFPSQQLNVIAKPLDGNSVKDVTKVQYRNDDA